MRLEFSDSTWKHLYKYSCLGLEVDLKRPKQTELCFTV